MPSHPFPSINSSLTMNILAIIQRKTLRARRKYAALRAQFIKAFEITG